MMCMPFCLRHISIGFLEEDSFETWSNRHSFSYTRSLLPLPTLPTFLKFSLSIGASPQQLPQGLKFEPYGRTLAKMLGTLLKVPCEAGCRRVFGGKKRSPGLGFFWCMKYYPVIYVGIIRYQYKDPLSNNQHFNGKEGSPFFFFVTTTFVLISGSTSESLISTFNVCWGQVLVCGHSGHTASEMARGPQMMR